MACFTRGNDEMSTFSGGASWAAAVAAPMAATVVAANRTRRESFGVFTD
jgi:hypothetical protein